MLNLFCRKHETASKVILKTETGLEKLHLNLRWDSDAVKRS